MEPQEESIPCQNLRLSTKILSGRTNKILIMERKSSINCWTSYRLLFKHPNEMYDKDFDRDYPKQCASRALSDR